MAEATAPTGTLLRVYLGVTAWAAPLVRRHLARRLAHGKESPERWREKLGEASLPRPDGTLVWMHAVGLGEVLALRGLIEAMARARPDLHFLVTSSAKASGEVFARNRPPRTEHQFLPLDSAPFVHRFLAHWHPDLSVWAEQDLWPTLVVETQVRGIPLAMVNARMNARAYASRSRVASLYADLYARFALIAAQDAVTADHLRALSRGKSVVVMGSLKAACAPLADLPDERRALSEVLRARSCWCVASTHPADEAVVLAAQAKRFANDPRSLLILAPRLPSRRDEIVGACRDLGLNVALRSEAETPGVEHAVWLADTFGELGLFYRLCATSVIGGSFGETGGHNPWEAAALGSAILHGPDTANFADDYRILHESGGARAVAGADDLLATLDAPDLREMAARAAQVQADARHGVDEIAARLILLLGR